MSEATSAPEEADSVKLTPARAAVYMTDGLTKEFRQGEIITHVAQYVYDPVSGRAQEIYQDYVVVACQDCDLLEDYKEIEQNKPSEFNGILLYEAEAASVVKSRTKGDIFRRITGNQDDRYQFLEGIPADLDLVSTGLPPLIIDLKRFFTIPSSELYRQCTLAHGAQRRSRLADLYREHFQTRATSYLQRVGLPQPHQRPREQT